VKRIGLVLVLITCLLPASCSIITGESIGADAQGLLLSQVIADGNISEVYDYDENGRLISIYYVDYGATVSLEYNTDGLVVKSHEKYIGSNDISYSYDNEGILISMTYETSSGERAEFVKDTQGRIARELYFSNEEQIAYVTFEYDGKGNTTGMTLYANDDTTMKRVFRYDDQINPYRFALPPGLVQNNNIVHYRYEMSGGFVIQEYYSTFTYNAAGLPVTEIRVYADGYSFTIEYVYISKKSLQD
jgi:YD repeat-containing protein